MHFVPKKENDVLCILYIIKARTLLMFHYIEQKPSIPTRC